MAGADKSKDGGKTMKGKKKQFLVLGLGRFGSAVARSLCEMGHEVLAVDSDAEAVQAISPHVTQAVQADATDDEVFSSLDAGSYDAAIVSIGSNVRDSILISVLCKEAGVPLVVAKASDDLHAKVLSKVGVDRVVFPEKDMGQRAARALVMPQMLDLMTLSGDARVAEMHLPEKWQNKTLVQADIRRNWGVTVLAVRRGDQTITTLNADFLLLPGDIVLVLGTQQAIDTIQD